MNNKLTVYDENGLLEEVEVLDFFQVDGYDHEYILYTKNEEADKDNIITYVSILRQVSEDEFHFEKITDPEEEKKVDEEIQKELESLSSQA